MNDLIAALEALRGDLARQHGEVVVRLDAIVAMLRLTLPPPPPDLNPLGGLMSANHLRTERLLAELQAKLSRGATPVAPAATVLPMPRRGDEPA